MELTFSDTRKIARWLNIPLEEFLDMDMDLSMNDLICAGVIKVSDGQEDDG